MTGTMPDTKFLRHISCEGVISKKDFSCSSCGKITDITERELVQPQRIMNENRSKYPKNKHGIYVLTDRTTTQKSDMDRKFDRRDPRKKFARVNS